MWWGSYDTSGLTSSNTNVTTKFSKLYIELPYLSVKDSSMTSMGFDTIYVLPAALGSN